MRPRLAQLHASGATTTGQCMVWNQTDLTWEVSAGVPLVDPSTTKGDILARSSSALARLAVGSNGQVLEADSTQTLGVKWATLTALTDPTTTKGDLITRTSSAITRRAVGSNGQVLTADSAETDGVKWATPSGGGGSLADDGVTLGGADDYDFSASTSLDTVPSPWAFVRSGAGATQLHYQEDNNRGVLKQEGSYTYMQGIERALPAGFATALFRVSAIPGTGNEGFGPWLSAGSGGKMCHFTLRATAASNLTFFGSPTATVGTDLGAHVWQPGPMTNWYFKIVRNSSSSWDFLFGPSPALLSTFFGAVNVPTATQGFTPVNIGFGFLCLGGGMKIAAIDYVKFT